MVFSCVLASVRISAMACREAITAASTSAALAAYNVFKWKLMHDWDCNTAVWVTCARTAICFDLLIPVVPPPFLLPPPLPPPTLRRDEEEEERTLLPPLALRVPPLPFDREEAPPPRVFDIRCFELCCLLLPSPRRSCSCLSSGSSSSPSASGALAAAADSSSAASKSWASLPSRTSGSAYGLFPDNR